MSPTSKKKFRAALGILRGIDPHTLDLWKPVDITSINTKPTNTLRERIKSKGATLEMLDPTARLSVSFPTQPPEARIHIIVKMRDGTRPLKRCRLDMDLRTATMVQGEGVQPSDEDVIVIKMSDLPRLFPSGLSPDVLDINTLRPHIQRVLDEITPIVVTFLKNPELPCWVPSTTDETVSNFLSDLRIPVYKNKSPSLLYHNLHSCHDDDVLETIFERGDQMDNNKVGVDDLEAALEQIGQHEDWTEDIRPYVGPVQGHRNKANTLISNRAIRKVFAARLVVFRLFLQLAKDHHGCIQPEHKRFWLLFQLSNPLPEISTPHPFIMMKECLDRASDSALEILIKDFEHIQSEYFPESRFTIALDEAQQAVQSHRFSFMASGESTKFRSILPKIVKVFSGLVVQIGVSGTELSLEEVDDTPNYGAVGKPSSRFQTFFDLGMNDNPVKLERILQRYIPSSVLNSPSGICLRARIREYLPGRCLNTFLELLLANGVKSPHTLLNRYIEKYLDCPPGDIDFYEHFTVQEPPLENLDSLRGKFISSDETKNVSQPMACTLALN